MSIRKEFEVHAMNQQGVQESLRVAEAFSTLLDALEPIVPPGRLRALVITKLEEASFFAKRAVAEKPENQFSEAADQPRSDETP